MSRSADPALPRLTDSALETAHTNLILRTKWKIALNAVRNMRRHLYLHAGVGTVMAVMLFGGGTAMFAYVFHFMMKQPVFGAPLMDRLVGIVLMIFFSMLLFSNLIITLSTTYISKEVEFLMGLPISRQSIFRQKLVESIIYSSWAFALLSLPLFVAFGWARSIDWKFYPLILLLAVPFLSIPATLGSIVTMLLAAVLPARKTRTLCIALGVMSMAMTAVLGKVTGLGQMLARANERDFLQIMEFLSVGNSPLLPSAWLSNALQAIAPYDKADIDLGKFAYWFGMLMATALFLLELCRWLVPPLYYRGWCLSRDAAVREVETNTKFTPFRWIDHSLERVFSSPVAGLLSKDLKTFWRDPAQWTQLVILFGLLVIYVMNLGWSKKYSRTMEIVVSEFKTILSYFNLAATCFILSILTTRFIYPMLSLEGRGFWTVGLAPIPRTRVVWQKFILCLVLCLAVCVPLTILSCSILQVPNEFLWKCLGMGLVMSFGLSSMSIGIGAILPDFKEDNPARIANGIGGTLNVLLSLLYIAASVFSLAIPAIVAGASPAMQQRFAEWSIPFYLGAVGLQAVVIWLPLRAGLKRWEQLEH